MHLLNIVECIDIIHSNKQQRHMCKALIHLIKRVLGETFKVCVSARSVGSQEIPFLVINQPNVDGICFNMGDFKALIERPNIRTIRTYYTSIVRCTDVSKMALYDIL